MFCSTWHLHFVLFLNFSSYYLVKFIYSPEQVKIHNDTKKMIDEIDSATKLKPDAQIKKIQ